MALRNRPNLTVRVTYVAVPEAESEQRAALVKLGEAIADDLIGVACAELAAALGVAPEEIDRERGALDADAREMLERMA